MYSTICYEEHEALLSASVALPRISYIKCSPPTRLRSKGTVVLLHGAYQTNWQFRHVIDLFAMAGYITIAPNLPGRKVSFGISAQRHADSRVELAESLASLLDCLRIEDKVHLIGHDLGAEVALHFATRYTRRIASVTCGGRIFESAPTPLQEFLSDTRIVPKFDQVQAVLKNMSHSAKFNSYEIEEYVETFQNPEILQSMQEYHGTCVSVPPLCLKDTHGLPCLVLESKFDGSTSASLSTSLATKLFGTTIRKSTIEDANMLLAEEQPETFALTILRFLNTQPSRNPQAVLTPVSEEGMTAKL